MSMFFFIDHYQIKFYPLEVAPSRTGFENGPLKALVGETGP